LGGSSSLGTFRIAEQPHIPRLPKSYSVSADGKASQLTPSQLGRQELYTQVPFQAVFGLQKRERAISQAFASYAADLDIDQHKAVAVAAFAVGGNMADSRGRRGALLICT
jgi:hypothetical protein